MPPVVNLPMVERDEPLSRLTDTARLAEAGSARLVLLSGPAGIGKSTLAAAALDSLVAPWQIESANGYRTDRSFDVPFGQLGTEIPPGLDPLDGLTAAVVESCRRRLAAGPLAVLVEDLHFMDPVTIAVLPRLLEELADEPLLVVATSRPAPPTDIAIHRREMAALVAHRAVIELGLEPLSVHGVATILSALGGRVAALSAEELHRRTGGVPFLVEAVVRAPELDESVPWTVAQFVHDELDALGPEAIEVAEAASLAAGGIPTELLAHWPDGIRAGGALVAADVLVVDTSSTPTVAVRHALVADAIRAEMPPSRAAIRHRQLAEALSAGGDGMAAEVARHWAAAGEPSLAAAPALVAADALLRSGSNVRATELYELVIDAGLPHLDDSVYERAATAAGHAGRVELAARWGLAAAQARRAGPRTFQVGGGWVNPLVAQSAGEQRTDALAAGLAESAYRALAMGQMAEAGHLAHQAEQAARGAGDQVTRANVAIVLLLTGHAADAATALAEVIADSARRGNLVTAAIAGARTARVHWATGELQLARQANQQAVDAAGDAGAPDLQRSIEVASAFLSSWCGEMDEALAWAQHLETSGNPLGAVLARVVLLAVDLERGDLDPVAAGLAALVPTARALAVPYYTIPVLTLSLRFHLLLGELTAAEAVLAELELVSMGAHHEFIVDELVGAAVVAALADDRGALDAVAQRLATVSGPRPGDDLAAAAAFIRGLEAGTGVAAAAAYRAAAELWERSPRWGFAADAWLAAADADPGRLQARADRTRARRIAERHDLHRVSWRLALADRDRTPAGAATNLTDREHDVAVAAARGDTNREIAEQLGLSELTVRNYLSNVFTKLGITRREQLTTVRDDLG